MKVLAIRTGKEVQIEEVGEGYEGMRKFLKGGYVETLTLRFGTKSFLMVLDEEGKLKGLPRNRLFVRGGDVVDFLVGDAFLLKLNKHSVTEKDLAYIKKYIDIERINL